MNPADGYIYIYRPSLLVRHAIIAVMVNFACRLIPIFLIIADVAIPLTHLFFRERSQLFDPDDKVNLSAVLVSIQLLLAAIVMGGIYIRERRQSTEPLHGTWLWLLLTIAFTVLAVNAIFRLPEILPTGQWESPDTVWLLLLPYPVILAPLVVLIGICVIWLTRSRFGNHRSWSTGVVAALACWFLAIILDGTFKLSLMPSDGFPTGWFLHQVLKLIGLTLFLWSVAHYARHLRAPYAASTNAQPLGRLLSLSLIHI